MFFNEHLIYNPHLIIAKVDVNIHTMCDTHTAGGQLMYIAWKSHSLVFSVLFSRSFWRLVKTARLKILLKLGDLDAGYWLTLQRWAPKGRLGSLLFCQCFDLDYWKMFYCNVRASLYIHADKMLHTHVANTFSNTNLSFIMHGWHVLYSSGVLICFWNQFCSMSGITCCHGDKLWASLSEMLIPPWILANLCLSTWCQLQWVENRGI